MSKEDRIKSLRNAPPREVGNGRNRYEVTLARPPEKLIVKADLIQYRDGHVAFESEPVGMEPPAIRGRLVMPQTPANYRTQALFASGTWRKVVLLGTEAQGSS